MTKLKITGKHLSEDGKEICTHYSDGVVVKEEIKDGPLVHQHKVDMARGTRFGDPGAEQLRQDEIQEDTTSMEEKLEALNN